MRGTRTELFRRAALLLLTALPGSVPVRAQTPPPLRIGMEEDLSTAMASVYGKGAVVAAQMAVEDWGPEVIGRKIELLTGDGRSKPDLASALVRQWFDQQDVQMVTGLSNSAIGLAVQGMAREKNRSASSPDLAQPRSPAHNARRTGGIG